MQMSAPRTPALGAPTSLAWRFVKYLLGFGVWFVIGLAPLLGAKKIPLFSAVIDLYPDAVRWWLIPLSGLLMGMMGVVVEFASGQAPDLAVVKPWFRRAAIVFLVAFLLLIVVYAFTVVLVAQVQPGGTTERFATITGTLTVPGDKAPTCACVPGTPAQECVEGGTSEAAVRACFGPNRIAIATLLLALLYLTVTGAFAASVGLLLLSQRQKKNA